jgi:hypothetical protein
LRLNSFFHEFFTRSKKELAIINLGSNKSVQNTNQKRLSEFRFTSTKSGYERMNNIFSDWDSNPFVSLGGFITLLVICFWMEQLFFTTFLVFPILNYYVYCSIILKLVRIVRIPKAHITNMVISSTNITILY